MSSAEREYREPVTGLPLDVFAPAAMKDGMRDVANGADDAADAAERAEQFTDVESVDESVLQKVYAEAVGDVLRWLAGDARPTDALQHVLNVAIERNDL